MVQEAWRTGRDPCSRADEESHDLPDRRAGRCAGASEDTGGGGRGGYGDSHDKMVVVEVVKSYLENKNNISIKISKEKQRVFMA